MATAADVATKVLDGLRRSGTFAPNTDNYHALILQFINQAMNEVQEAWDWQVLRKTVTVTGVASQSVYTLDSGGEADIDVGPEGKIMYEKQGPVTTGEGWHSSTKFPGALPMVWDVTTATEAFRLEEVSPERMERLHLTDDNTEHERPTHFTIYRDNDDIFMRVWPVPSGIRSWKLRMIDPQVDIAKTDTMANITMQVPIRAIWMKALVYGLIERGETDAVAVWNDKADYALQSAIALERGDTDDTSWPQ